MAKVNDVLARAIDSGDHKWIAAIADAWRMAGGTYAELRERVREVRPSITDAEWDALLYEADTEE